MFETDVSGFEDRSDRCTFCTLTRKRVRSRCVIWPFFAIAAMTLAQNNMADFFQSNCAACHTIGGGAGAGPDLKDVTTRRNREWLIHFIENPQKMVDSNDQVARKLVEESGGMVMPAIPGIDAARAEALIHHIASKSGTAPASVSAVEPAFTPTDVDRGERIVRGSARLENGGPACISCHNVSGLTSLGGGRLGPDLTRSYDRLGARKGMTAWLGATPTATMQAVYKTRPLTPEEISALVAYFESVSKAGAPVQEGATGTLVLIGAGGSLLGLVLMEGFWRKRFRAVRRPLVARRGS